MSKSGANTSKSMLWPSSRKVAEMPEIDSSADTEMLESDWPTNQIVLTCDSAAGDNFCYMDSVLVSILCGTETGQRLLVDGVQAASGTGCLEVIREFMYAP